jgi:3',5'-cyclic AMP phosphodiesterase CpdA
MTSAFVFRFTAAVVAFAAASVAAQAPKRVTLIAYGDTRFTDQANVTATNPRARAALIARIADERPDAILVSGDLPWHGGVTDDYAQFRAETKVWRAQSLRLLPALGNHEFSQCDAAACLENWWKTFPEFRGRRWYAASVEESVRVIALDTMSPLTAGSEQRVWLEKELASLPRTIDFVVLTLHHPPVADIQTRVHVDHNPRPNELALAELLAQAARSSRPRFVVVAGHIHNYERFLQDNIVYLVSGGGGAVPYEVDRTPPDLYKGIDFPNYHYVKLTIEPGKLRGEMYRLDEPAAPAPHFTLKDAFDVSANAVASVSRRTSD